MKRIRLHTWGVENVHICHGGDAEITFIGRRSDSGPEHEVIVTCCSGGIHQLMREFAQALNAKLEAEKRKHGWHQKRIADAWNSMENQR